MKQRIVHSMYWGTRDGWPIRVKAVVSRSRVFPWFARVQVLV